MEQRLFLPTGLIALAVLWFVYDLGLRQLVLAFYRNRLFQLRFELFTLGMAGELAFESDVYRSLEILLNGLVQYAHTVSYYAYRVAVNEERKNASHSEPYRYRAFRELLDHIDSLPQPARADVQRLLADTQKALAKYMALTSPVFLLFATLSALQKVFHLMHSRQEVPYVQVFEEQAYRAQRRDLNLVRV